MKASGWNAQGDWNDAVDLSRGTPAEGVARLFARYKVEALEDAIRQGTVSEESIRPQIVDLGVHHAIVTRFTSLVAVEKTPSRPVDAALASAQFANAQVDESLAFAQGGTASRLMTMLALALARPVVSNRAVLTLILALASAIPVAVTVVLVGMAFLGEQFPDPEAFATLVLDCFVITLGVAVLLVLAAGNNRVAQDTPAQPSSPAPQAPALFKRLPLPQRGALCYLTMQDHYVDVVTDRGHALILMRLSDAIAETAPVRGLQIHRSHWIALDAVRAVSKDDGKALVEMSDGVRLPVSRSYLAAAREAGLVV